jgi:UDP-N-acetyl-D-mannosaminuronic acid dehydrogenase
MKKEKVCILGLGYIGLPTAALLATKGYAVHGVDVKPEVVETINKGLIHIVEPELDAFVKSAVQSGNLRASLKPDYADIFIITVPTPVDQDNNPDITYVIEATRAIVPYIREGNYLILESTSPIGTTEKLVELLKGKGINTDGIYVAYSPERVLPGQTMRELVQNDRIVGGITNEAAIHVALFYESFVQGEVVVTNSRTAEMSKLTENACRDVNIAFANELSILCDKFGINVWELISLANRHPRINILKPGSGVGGHCIAIDPWFIVAEGKEDARIIRTAREINNRKPIWVVEKIMNAVTDFKKKNNRNPRVACMGVAFKPNIDDLRESPSLLIVKQLATKEIDLMVCEPNINKHKSIELTDYRDAINQADIVVFLVAHKEFKTVKIPDDKIVIDICGVKSKY